MALTPQTVTLSDIHKSYSDVRTKLDQNPVLLLRNSEPEAWIVSVKQWDAMQRAIKGYSIALEEARKDKPKATLEELFERAGVDPHNYEAVPA